MKYFSKLHRPFNAVRRKMLLGLIGGSMLGPALFPGLIRLALALGRREYPQGIQVLEGDVRINDVQALVGSLVNIGDTVATGMDGKTIFVVQRSVYLLRENTRLTLSEQPDKSAKDKMISVLRLLNGKVLSVFGKGKRRLETSTAVIGVRGTAVYLESDPAKTYVCTCYGRAEIRSRVDESIRESVRTFHHEKPRFVFGEGASQLLVEAPVFNHTDEELIMLESMVGRVPPFFWEDEQSDYDDSGRGGY